MPRFCPNLSTLFTEHPFLDRFGQAAKAGFSAVEYQFPYEFSAADVGARVRDNGLTVILHNIPAGDSAAGDRGIAADPDRVGEFRDGVKRAIDYAGEVGCRQLNCLAGIIREGLEHVRAEATFIENVSYTAGELERVGIRLVVEPINTKTIPGFFLNRTDQAIRILDEAGSANAFIQYDIFHAQRMEGDLGETLTRAFDRIGHIQFADNPGRHEPGTGEINFAFLFGLIDRLGYDGWLGMEYTPAAGTVEGLGWLGAYGFRAG